MKKNIIITALLFVFYTLDAQENPFMQMAGKKYAEYCVLLCYECNEHIILDTAKYRKVVRQVEEVARHTGSLEWKLIWEYFELKMYSAKQRLHGTELYPDEEKIALELIKKAQKVKNGPLEALFRTYIIAIYWEALKNYELAFQQCELLDKVLETVTVEDYPDKSGGYAHIGQKYYAFKDYKRAILYHRKALNEPATPYRQQQIRNEMGLAYLQLNMLDSAYFYFNAIRQATDEYYEKILFEGIAERNMGSVLLLRGDTVNATPLLENSIEKIFASSSPYLYKDFTFASGCAVDLAKIHINKGNLQQAKMYLDSATYWLSKTRIHRNKHLYYEAHSKYYAAIGDKKRSIVYMDSMLNLKNQMEEEFNSILLLRMEQKESAAQERKLEQEKIRSVWYKRSLMIALAGLLLTGSLLFMYQLLYKKKKEAYKGLYRQIKEQDRLTEELQKFKEQSETPPKELSEQEKKDDIKYNGDSFRNQQLFSKFKEYLLHDRFFTNSEINIDKIITDLATNRTYLFDAVKAVADKTPNEYIHFLQLEEAKALLETRFEINVDSVSEECGFSSRSTFYRLFRDRFKLSPNEYRKMAKIMVNG